MSHGRSTGAAAQLQSAITLLTASFFNHQNQKPTEKCRRSRHFCMLVEFLVGRTQMQKLKAGLGWHPERHQHHPATSEKCSGLQTNVSLRKVHCYPTERPLWPYCPRHAASDASAGEAGSHLEAGSLTSQTWARRMCGGSNFNFCLRAR